MPRPAVRHVAALFVAALGSFLTAALFHQGASFNVLATMAAITTGRRARADTRRSLLVAMAMLPAVGVLAAGVGEVLVHSFWLAAVLYTVAIAGAYLSRGLGSVAAQLGRLISLPLLVVFVAPAPLSGGSFPERVAWGVIACAIAAAWTLLMRAVVFSDLAPEGRPAPASPVRRPTRGPSIYTRLAARNGAAMALAFPVSHWIFPHHWSWSIVTVFTVGSGARSRGEVLHKSVLRLGGAIVGAVVATLFAGLVGGHDDEAIVLIFALLLGALVGQEFTYAAWAACVTGMLALLYGIYGEPAASLLDTRVEAIVVGAACAVLPAWVLIPVRGEMIVRRRIADALAALSRALDALPQDDGAAATEIATFDTLLAEAEKAARFSHGEARRSVLRLEGLGLPVRNLADAARRGSPFDRRTADVMRKRIGAARRALAASRR